MKRLFAVAGGVLVAAAATGSVLADSFDLGNHLQNQIRALSHPTFGIGAPLEQSSAAQITQQQAEANPTSLVTLATPLRARVVATIPGATNIDMMALWPNDERPTHLIACNEQGATNPGLLRIDLASGEATTIVTGTDSCDPVRRTPWVTILFGEEAGGGPNGGRMYELINPLETTGVTLNRATGQFSGGTGTANLTPRPALGRLSFEGLAIYPSGVAYYGDEQRPSNGTPGGAYFKFIPSTPRTASSGPITSLDQSPFAAGSVYGLRVGRRGGGNGNDYGQGTQYGFGSWIPIPAAADHDLRAQAVALKLTGYYRPEDIDIDASAAANGRVGFCGPNTGNESEDQFYGEVICITDGTLAESLANSATPEVRLFVVGSPAFAMPDNIAYQPGRGNWIVHEDADTTYLTPHNDDIWSCAPDGSDPDLQSDGCVRIGTLNDLTAEWTGGIFDASGRRFFVSVQHNISGKGTILEITGWG